MMPCTRMAFLLVGLHWQNLGHGSYSWYDEEQVLVYVVY